MSAIEEIIHNFRTLKAKGPVISTKPRALKNDGAVGNTFEREMGVDENNLTAPDYKGWEFKTKRQLSGSAASLFTLKPDSTADDNYMRENWGVWQTLVPDSNGTGYKQVDPSGAAEELPPMKVLRTSVFNHEYRTYYPEKRVLRAVNDYAEEKYRVLLYEEAGDGSYQLADDSVYWHFDSLRRASEGKLKNTVVCLADEVQIAGQTHFQYTSAIAYEGFRFENLLQCLEDGTARYEHRLGRYASGKKVGQAHNHGGGFRLNRASDFAKLFDKSYEIG